nr:hypothetical protein [Tanacetum cinerariifolium]
DVYTEATPLALKVPVVDYQIHTKHNKPYYKIIRADVTHQLFLRFISLLRNFDREDLEMLWKIVKERYASSEPKNFSDDFLLNAFKTMFEKPNELEEEASKVIKRKSETSEEKAAKKQKLDEEVEKLKTHLQIVSNDEDDVYTEATPLALKVHVVDYQIHTENNKPYYKIIRADETYQLFLSFISLLKNFDREDLEML